MKSITIGRNPENDIVYSSLEISGDHAEIIETGDAYTLVDHSKNGTFVNGKYIHHTSCTVRRGDSVVFAGVEDLNWNKVSRKGQSTISMRGVKRSPTVFVPFEERAQAGGGGVQVYVQNIQNVGANYNPQPESQGANVFAILGFIFAFFIPLLGVIFSAIGISKANKMGGKQKGLAIAGLILSIIYIVAVIIVYSIFFAAIGTLGAMSF